MQRWIWDTGFTAVAGEAISFEVFPPVGDIARHNYFLAGWGMPIGEMFDLERLAHVCQHLNRSTFFFASMPINIPGGVSSPPPTAQAIFRERHQLVRSLTGLFSGPNLIIRTMIGEHWTPEKQATFFSWFAVSGSMGLFLGPIIGGALVNPASQYLSIFGGTQFLGEYPYVLPGLVLAAISATAALSSFLMVEESIRVNKKTDQTGVSVHSVPKACSQQLLQIPVGAVDVVLGPAAFMSFTAVQLAVNRASPSPGVLGKLHWVAELGFSVIRSIMPGVATAVFAAGVRGNIQSSLYVGIWLGLC
ncbi:Levodione reductase [Emericellopsis cladophorae]|uniref:Levodione reductase n=1 Tax=Emericellopsis cladophorae TaxID=2686198 RepID=A0A9P9Y4Q5_9HYPO|nr:Levodione reductase [Emericellopsis cladophorae]KAI6783504.1 Levodione reductase [Emericellopsis cladophorae]